MDEIVTEQQNRALLAYRAMFIPVLGSIGSNPAFLPSVSSSTVSDQIGRLRASVSVRTPTTLRHSNDSPRWNAQDQDHMYQTRSQLVKRDSLAGCLRKRLRQTTLFPLRCPLSRIPRLAHAGRYPDNRPCASKRGSHRQASIARTSQTVPSNFPRHWPVA
ncbi:hypothetical protein GQ53DRAFT_135125 [Thozetella sp. PMI_491]|nr:hypothetical protein GQ53DRAFT_135125 [Thozetella sp. PMI_491]